MKNIFIFESAPKSQKMPPRLKVTKNSRRAMNCFAGLCQTSWLCGFVAKWIKSTFHNGLIFSIAVILICVAISCKQTNRKGKNHYTVYQAGQTGTGMAMKAGNTNMMNITLSLREMMLANIKIDTVQLKSFPTQIVLTGTTMFDPRNKSAINAWVGGQIKKMYVRNPGEYIHAGEKLYDLYSPELLSVENDYLLVIKQKKLFKKRNIQIDAAIKAMKQKLLRYGLSEEQITSLNQNDKAMATIPVYSKRSGYLIKKVKEEGDYINEGDTVFQLVKDNKLWVKAQLFDTEIPLLSQHPKIWVEADALPGKKIPSNIVYNNPVMDGNSSVHMLQIAIKSPEEQLEPGMLVYVYLQTDSKKPVVAIPKSAIVYEQKQYYIWMQMPSSDGTSSHKTFMRMPVQLGKDNETQVEIIHGVQPGEVIVSSGTYLLNSEHILRNGNNSMAGMKM